MPEMCEINIEKLHQKFMGLSYTDKVVFFDQHFGLLFFDYEHLDQELMWYRDLWKLETLAQNFNKAKKAHDSLTKKISFQDTAFVFDIKPMSAFQRRFLNEHILKKYLQVIHTVVATLDEELAVAPQPINVLDEKINHLLSVMDWAELAIQKRETTLRAQFLRVFYNGFTSFPGGKQPVSEKRRNVIELFLYGQGYLMAHYIEILQTKRTSYKAEKPVSFTGLTLPMKIALLHRLGIVHFLSERFTVSGSKTPRTDLAELIAIITNESPESSTAILRHLCALGQGSVFDPLTNRNIEAIQKALTRHNLPC